MGSQQSEGVPAEIMFIRHGSSAQNHRGGEKVIPRRVDEAILQHPAVEQALAFAVPHLTLYEDLAAAVALGSLPDPGA